MSDALTYVSMASLALLGLAMLTFAGLRAWQGWLDLKRLELSAAQPKGSRGNIAERIEMADLKERIRKLEAIAACVDL
jgi:hypothetical protein